MNQRHFELRKRKNCFDKCREARTLLARTPDSRANGHSSLDQNYRRHMTASTCLSAGTSKPVSSNRIYRTVAMEQLPQMRTKFLVWQKQCPSETERLNTK